MVILVLALAAPLQAIERLSIPQYPMICQTEKQSTLWSLPDMTDCPIPAPNISHVPISQTRNVYMLNDLEYTTQGWACRKIRKTLRKFTTLSNVPINEPVGSEILPVDEQECKRMIKNKECSLGKLIEENDLWTTSNKIDASPKMWFIGSFWWTEVKSENCLLFSVQINSHWGEEGIGTSFGESNNCSYSKGLCVLSDNTVLKWEPTKDRMCRYIKIGTWEGKFLDNTWLSDDAQLALHFAKPTPKFWDCSNILEISEQGLATVTRSRSKRSVSNQKLSLVTSPEMAAKLTYLDKEMADTLTFTFTHSLKTFCQNLDLVKKWALAAYLSNPTGLARMIFENDYVTAKREGSSLLRVWPCIPIKNDEYSFKATNLSECFDLIPIQFKAESREHLAFLNPLTMTIEPTARKAPCSIYGKTIVEINHEVLEVNQTSGEFRKIQPRPINLRELKSYSIPEIKSHSFHQLMLVNLTDLKTHTFMSNLVRASEISYRIEQKDMHIVKTLSDQWKEAGNSLVTEIIGDYTWIWKVIISILIAILTLDLVIRWGIKAAENYLGQGQLGNMLFGQSRNIINRARQTSINRNTEEIPMVKVNKNPEFKREKTPSVRSQRRKMSWIPKVSKFPQSVETEGHTVNVMRANKMCDKKLSKDMDATASQNFSINTLQSCPTITGVFINNKAVKCLIDTGASISIAPISLARTLGLNLTPATISITSASGHEINVLAQAEVLLEIADTKLPVTIRVVEDNQITGNRTYQLIIGCDILKRLPPITFDFNKGKINFENKFNYSDKNKSKSKNMRVAAIEAKTILPGKHGLVSVKIKTNGGEKLALVHSLDQRLEKDHLALIEAVVTPNAKENKILIANPTTEPKHICKGMHIALADEVWSINEQPWLTQVENINVNEYVNTVEANPTFKVDFSKSSVQGEDRQKLEKLCEEFSDVFSKTQYDLGSCIAGEYDIITTTEEPITSRPHRVPFKYREELQKHIEALLKSGVMVKSDTPWVSNIVLVQKKDGGLRPCIDFRKLNEVTVPDHFPLPRLESIMERIGNCNYYSSLDLSSGYLQIRLTERASRKCGVIMEDEIYQMTHMPFGLRNATSAFARVMAHVISGLDECVLAYVDDFLVFTKSPDFDEHLNALRQVFTRLRKYFLKISPKKCIFASREMNFLGYTINAKGYTPSIAKVETINNLPAPTTVKEVRQAIGMASFFRKHIQNFSLIVEPLTKLTRKEIEFHWGDEQQQAFDKIKKILTSQPVLVFPDYEKPFHIFTDASLTGQGGALMQKDIENNTYKAIAYCSRTLTISERKWAPVQIELGAIIFSLRQFRPFIYMAEIELHTDHKPLAYLLKKADASPNLARWLIELQNYNIKIVHIAGKENLLADALSRLQNQPEVEQTELEDIAEFPVCFTLPIKDGLINEHYASVLTLRKENENYAIDIKQEQENDMEAADYIKFIKTGELPEDISPNDQEKFVLNAENLRIIGDILCHKLPNLKPRIFVPSSLRALIFDSFHSSQLGGGHMNLKKTLKKCRKYYWPRMHADILTWTRNCITCQLRHSPNPPYRAEMQMVPVNTLFAKVGLDLAGPFPLTQNGNKHVMNIICWFTKYVISVPVPDTKAMTLAKAFLNNCYLKYGGCVELVTDNATAFTSEFFKDFCSMLYINKSYATPHWSQGNSVTERSFRTFHNILSKYISKDQPDFDEFLDCACFCYNTSIHASTGETPFFLMFGRDPIFCVDQILDPSVYSPVAFTDISEFKQRLITSLRCAWEAADEANKQAQLRAKTQYDKLVRNPTVTVGDRVLLRNYAGKIGTSKKFHMPWKGVFRVVKIDGVHVTIVSCNSPQGTPRKVHINQLKKCFEALTPACTVPELSSEEEKALERAEENEGIENENISQEIETPDIQENQNSNTELVQKNTQKKYNLRENPKKKKFSF
uniref:RNA-directed DNA polymerase n=1 Tax=Meloidogyne enterolobii TaxID=390850 RepID=A0A6V7XTS7_MELEN|nr:unnamed protein product [Meloidogyne enterolobii]